MSFEGDAGGEVVEQGGPDVGGAAGAPAQGAPPAQQSQGEDPMARILQSMEQFGQRLDTLDQRLTPAQQAEAEPEEEFDLEALLSELPDEAFDPETNEITPQGSIELMRQMARAEADTVRSEYQEARQQAEFDAYADQLETKYPDLQDPGKQQEVLAEAQRLARQMGQPQMVSNPHFFEVAYLAMAARSHAAAEVPAGGADRGVRLEQPGGGGGPVDSGDGPSAQQQIVGAARGGTFRLGSG